MVEKSWRKDAKTGLFYCTLVALCCVKESGYELKAGLPQSDGTDEWDDPQMDPCPNIYV